MCARVRPHTVWNTGTVINAAKFGSNTEHVQVQYLPYSLVFGEVKLHGPILYQALVSVSGKLGLILGCLLVKTTRSCVQIRHQINALGSRTGSCEVKVTAIRTSSYAHVHLMRDFRFLPASSWDTYFL